MSGLQQSYALLLGCLIEAKSSGSLITTKWQYNSISSPSFVRPESGDTSATMECPRCKRIFTVRVENLKKATIKSRTYTAVGAVLALSLLVWLPMLIHFGSQTVDEDAASSAVLSVGSLFGLTAVSLVVGLPLYFSGRKYSGIKKLRLVKPDGSVSTLTKGHKLP